jgi:hypothetical protein
MSSQPLAIITELKESIANHERQLESLGCRISGVERHLTPDLGSSRPITPVSPSKSLKEVEFPLKAAKPVDGIIAYLTRKHGGNVQDELSQLLQSRLSLIVLWGMSLTSLLTRFSVQRTSQAYGFAGISTKCAFAPLITQSAVGI